jgi:5-methylcytosine-specific restriction protein A
MPKRYDNTDGRLRGRRAVAQRKRRLEAEPLCRDCLAKGITELATVPDHIIPIAKQGKDEDSNIRCLCAACHLKRTAEQFGHKAKLAIGIDGWPIR